MILKEFVSQCRILIARGFCQEVYARDFDNKCVDTTKVVLSELTCASVCLIGAGMIVRDRDPHNKVLYVEYKDLLWDKLNGDTVKWNDSHTQEEVLQLLDSTIAAL